MTRRLGSGLLLSSSSSSSSSLLSSMGTLCIVAVVACAGAALLPVGAFVSHPHHHPRVPKHYRTTTSDRTTTPTSTTRPMYCPNEERIAKDIPRFMMLSSFQTSSSTSSTSSTATTTTTTTTTATTAAATPVTELDSTSPKKANKLAWLDQQTAMSNATISPLAKEFREKIESFLEFEQEQEEEPGHAGAVAATTTTTTTTTTTSWFVIPNHRLRALYEGVVASAQEPPVYKSFEILFQDLLPLRVAGRMIFRRLYQTLRTQYLEPQQDENQQILQQLLPPQQQEEQEQDTLRHEIQKSRRLFMELVEYCNNYYHRVVATNKNGDFPLVLNKSDLIETGIATEIAIRHYGLDSETQWLETSFPHQQSTIGFADFYLVLAQSNHNQNNNNNNNSSSSSYTNGAFEILKSVTKQLREREPKNNNKNKDDDQGNNWLWRNNPKKQKHVDSYQHMVQSFQEWEGIVLPNEDEEEDDLSSSSSSSRRIQVLRGCFVGARNPRVVQALQIVYVDYQALRVAGNLIFKLMSAIVHSSGGGRHKNNSKNKRSKQQQQQ